MIPWIAAAGVLLVLVLLFWVGSRGAKNVETFLTLDPATALAQRQMLQMEGEHRYNDLARLQSTLALLPDSQIEAALQQTVPAATNHTPSLLGLLGMKGHAGLDDGSNKSGAGVEQTGMVQAKINFCESQTTVNCDMLSDPRMAECGFCHRDGTDSRGKGHRGGMYISADDQIRANEVSNASSAAAQYKPTVGSCAPQNFTLMSENCQARELQLQCQAAGAPTSSNQCGQCYGKAAPSATGLLFMGGKPLKYQAYLHVSHPGGHAGGLVVNNTTAGWSLSLPHSESQINDMQVLPMPLTEGDQLTITIDGPPAIWAAWLSNKPTWDPSDQTARIVSLDIGITSMTPAGALEIAGDAKSGPVVSAFGSAPSAPNTVLWYMRRDEILNGMVSDAWYGATVPTAPNASTVGTNVAGFVKNNSSDISVGQQTIQMLGFDPASNIVKTLYIYMDNGAVFQASDGQTIPYSTIQRTVVLNVTVPATLMDPPLSDDVADCPGGPIVATEVGAGLFGSHSCFKADGSFNPTQYCLQELFQSAGGSQQGSLWPNSDAVITQIMAFVANAYSKDPSTVTLDDVVKWLNNTASIANYGRDSAGADPGFDAYKAACQFMLGFVPLNPCQGPTAQTGPHSPECLDYLYRTSGNPSLDGVAVDPASLPYASCTQGGSIAPLNPDGSVNQGNVTLANQYGAIPNIRAFYQGVYNQSRDSSDFYKQAAALSQCTGSTLEPPVTPPDACPPPASDEWQCMGPNEWQIPEVFHVRPNGGYTITQDQAAATCGIYGAQVATSAQVYQAQSQGADWCSTGWVADNASAMYPTNVTTGPGCGGPGVQIWTSSSGRAAVNCYGVKPPPGTQDVMPFNPASWSNVGTSPTWAVRSVNRQNNQAGSDNLSSIQCMSNTGGASCINFGDDQTCKSFLQSGDTTTYAGSATSGMNFGNQPYASRADAIINSRM
jgi:hypothetical protein